VFSCDRGIKRHPALRKREVRPRTQECQGKDIPRLGDGINDPPRNGFPGLGHVLQPTERKKERKKKRMKKLRDMSWQNFNVRSRIRDKGRMVEHPHIFKTL
jgi:hypothetical protein